MNEQVDKTQETMQYVGKKTKRVDGLALVTGQAVFADDIQLRDMLHIKILHSPHAHARIKKIDTSKAANIPGVKLILTHEDFATHYYTTAGQGYPEPSSRDTRIFDDTVRYVGDRVAAVAADTIDAAAKGIANIEVEYEILEAIFDPRESMNSKVLVHEQENLTMVHDNKRNLIAELGAELGDVEAALEKADHVFEQEYSVPYAQQAHIEPHIAVTWMDEHNRLIIRTATQVPFHVRRIVAEVLNIPVGRIRVIKPRIGGGFGSKQEILNDEICAAVTLKTGQPARLEYTREEELYAARSRHPQILKVRMGVKDDGFIEAIDLNILENGGAYGTHSLTVMSVTANKALSFYRAPNKKLLGRAVYTNMSVPGAYRGYGAPQGFFAMEVMLDEIAHKLNIDPTEMRYRNYVREGDDIPIAKILGEGGEGYPMKIYTNGIEECIKQGKKIINWDEIRSEKKEGRIRRGVGMIGCGQGSGIPGIDMAAAFIKMNEDASFNLLAGATDIGTGSDTMLAQIAAEVLEVPVEKIIVYSSDTDMTPFDTGAYASSTTYISGGAVKKAAEKVKQQILDMGKKLLGVDEAEIKNGQVIAADGKTISYGDICTKAFYTHEQHQIMANASHMSYDSPPPFNATFAEIELDTFTGIISVKKIVSISDAGQVINPQMAEGQVEGAIPQSLGYALSEYMIFDDKGAPINTNLFDYHIYTSIDMPEIIAKFVHTDEPTGPYGAKAIAEIPINGPAPAIANAVYNACGVRIRELPITPERVLQGIKQLT